MGQTERIQRKKEKWKGKKKTKKRLIFNFMPLV